MPLPRFQTAIAAGLAGLILAACGQSAAPPAEAPAAAPPAAMAASFEPQAEDFRCIRDMHPVRGFFVDNLLGDLEATLAVAQSETGGVYPPGSVVQLVPGEVMVKREAGFSAETQDWEFFELDVSPAGSVIRVRGTNDAVNQFGGNCLECHAKAEPQWDLICEQTHGCDPIPLTAVMVKAIQNTDPRCPPVDNLPPEQIEALELLAFLREVSAENEAP
ncbi:hypothetical protein [Hyphomonas sp.]|uniref:hypothetical protein n=1 Tax=Hyphomonas sp. TaxID=87 RepID=UPI0025BCFDDC|nr:hypothetical protein [Hyphomonas sp.]